MADIDQATQAIAALAPTDDPKQFDIETPAGAVQLREVISGQLGAGSRALMSLVLSIGLVLVMLAVFAAVSSRRRDFGRRRALGASRSAIVALVMCQTLFAALPGVILGLAAGQVVVSLHTRTSPNVGFVVAIGVLAVLTAVLGSIPPALLAALRDPVRVLRVP